MSSPIACCTRAASPRRCCWARRRSRPLIRRLCPQAEIQSRERFSQLIYDGPKKLTRLPRRSAVVAFSAEAVYAIAELIRRQRGGAAVVMGSLQPAHPQRPGRAVPVRRSRFSRRHRRDRHGAQHGRRPCRLRGPAQIRRPAHPLAPSPRRSARSPAGPGAIARTARSASPANAPTWTPTSSPRSRAMSFPPSPRRNGATRGSTSIRCRR